MKLLFLDTEFTELSPLRKLISIGIVDQDESQTFYAEVDGWKLKDVNEFVATEVLPWLSGDTISIARLKVDLKKWIEDQGEECVGATDSLYYDWLYMQMILGDDWPKNLAKEPLLLTMNYLVNFDRFEEILEQGFSTLRRHHALDDARANLRAWKKSGGDIMSMGPGSDNP